MNDASPPEGHYGAHEASEKLAELLGSRERVRVLMIARQLVRRRDQAEDLIHEAFIRTLEGRRRWPRGVAAIGFLVQTMRSIAADWNQDAKRLAANPPDEDLPSLAANPEEVAEAASEERHLLRALEDDLELHALAEALIAEWDKDDLLSLFDGDETRYATTRTRFRRKRDALSRTGGTPCPTHPTKGRNA